MPGQWILRDLYEIVPNVYTVEASQNWALVQYFALAPWAKITGIAWYRASTNWDAPRSLSIWYRDLPVRLWKTTDVPDNGAVGWQEVDLTDTPLLGGGYFSRIGAGGWLDVGGHFAAWGDHNTTLSSEAVASIPLQYALQRLNAGDVQPDSPGTARIYGYDLRVEPTYAGQFAAGGSSSDVAAWLSADGANYAGSPLADVKTVVENIYNETQDEAHGLAKISGDLETLKTRLSQAWADLVAGNLEGIPAFLVAWSDFHAQFVEETAPGVANLLEWLGEFTDITVFDYLAKLVRFANGIDAPPQLADSPDWELVDETDFVNSLLWPVEADVYRVVLSAFDPAGTGEAVGTQTRHGYLLKWAPANVEFIGEWHYANTVHADLSLGRRMPGLALIMNRPGAGHVQAWRRAEGA